MVYFDMVKNELKFISSSDIRLKLMVDLSTGPMKLHDFKINSFVSYSSISTNIHKLCNEGYVEKKNNEFQLTNIGKIYLISLMDFHDTLKTINEFSDFWLNHEITSLSSRYLKDISSLGGSMLIESDSSDLYMIHDKFANLFKGSKTLKVIFPYVHPEYPKLMRKLVSRGSRVEILLPDEIAIRFIKDMGESLVRSSVKSNNLMINIISDDVKFALAVSEKWVSIGLFKEDGSYDQSKLLVSDKIDAIAWGAGLFENYVFESKPIDLKEI